MQLRRKPARRGGKHHYFNLIEIMIVVVIIGMILGMVGPHLMKSLGKAKHKTCQSQIAILGNAAKDYYLDMSEYPSRLDDLITSPGSDKWDGPYLDPAKIPLDPWGESYHYDHPGQHGEFDIYSYGADKSSGGDSQNADIASWE